MNSFDRGVIVFFNHAVRKSWVFDQAVAILSANHMLKGAVFMTIVWWAWFRKDPGHPHNREHIVATMFSCAVAMAVGRLLALTLPYRLRPLHDERLNLVLPYGVKLTDFDQLSSFPSDHAVLFFALATGLCFTSRRIGAFALAYAAVGIALPRLYLGFHYPSDILAGAMVGITIAFLGNRYLAQGKCVQAVVSLSQSAPHYFYPLFFLLTFQMAELFESSRWILGGMFKVVKGIVA